MSIQEQVQLNQKQKESLNTKKIKENEGIESNITSMLEKIMEDKDENIHHLNFIDEELEINEIDENNSLDFSRKLSSSSFQGDTEQRTKKRNQTVNCPPPSELNNLFLNGFQNLPNENNLNNLYQPDYLNQNINKQFVNPFNVNNINLLNNNCHSRLNYEPNPRNNLLANSLNKNDFAGVPKQGNCFMDQNKKFQRNSSFREKTFNPVNHYNYIIQENFMLPFMLNSQNFCNKEQDDNTNQILQNNVANNLNNVNNLSGSFIKNNMNISSNNCNLINNSLSYENSLNKTFSCINNTIPLLFENYKRNENRWRTFGYNPNIYFNNLESLNLHLKQDNMQQSLCNSVNSTNSSNPPKFMIINSDNTNNSTNNNNNNNNNNNINNKFNNFQNNNNNKNKKIKGRKGKKKKSARNTKEDMLINEIKINLDNVKKIDLFVYSKIQGNVINIIKSHKGSQLFQKYLKNTSNDILHNIYIEIKPFLTDIIVDNYANYFVTKFFILINQKDRVDFLKSIENYLVKLSSDNIGTYPLQSIVENLGSKQEKIIVINSLKDHLEDLIYDSFGAHVIERILGSFEEDLVEFIYNYVTENFLKLSYNGNSICVIKKLLTFIHKKEIHNKLKEIIKENFLKMVVHPYANFVIQTVIESWPDYLEITELFKGKYFSLSLEKYASNVIERAIAKDNNLLTLYINEICDSGKISEIMKNSFGNYVIQKVVKISEGEIKNKIVFEAAKNVNKLLDIKLINKWKSILAKHCSSLNKEELEILNKIKFFST